MPKGKEIKRNVQIEDARIAFRNFTGKQGQFNPPGRRNFCVLLNDDTSEMLKHDGWNVRYLTPKDPDEKPQPYLPVAVKYDYYPPKIVLINSTGKAILTEETVHILDWAEITGIDMILRPYNWEVNGKSGVKAYLKTMYVTVAEDAFESKYRDVPDSGSYIDDDEPEPF